MKKSSFIILTLALLLGAKGVSVAQEAVKKMPKILILPSKVWASQKGYMIKDISNGKEVENPDYDKFSTDPDFAPVMAVVSSMITKAGYPDGYIKDLLAVLDKGKQEYGKKIAANILTDLETELAKASGCDVKLYIEYRNIGSGSSRQIQVTLNGVDMGTQSAIGTPVTGIGENMPGTPLPMLVEGALESRMEELVDQMKGFFARMEVNGRPGNVTFWVSNTAGINFDSFECKGSDWFTISKEWLDANTVKSDNTTSIDETAEKKYDVKIPLFDANQKPQDARSWIQPFVKILGDCGYTVKAQADGTSAVIVTITGLK